MFADKLENPPTNFNYDFSTNICLVLGKLNKLNSINLAKKIKKTLEENIGDFSEIEVAAPGFLNLNLSKKGTIRSILSYALKIKPEYAIGIEILHQGLNILEMITNRDNKYKGGRFRLITLNK